MQQEIIEKFDFYRNSARQWSRIALGAILCLIISIAGNFYLFTRPPILQSFGLTQDGRAIPMPPLSDPFMTQATILNFATKAVTEPFTLDHVHWKDQLAAVKGMFTEKGYKDFLLAIQKSGNIDTIQGQRLIQTAVVEKNPVILGQGLMNGVYGWKIETPIQIQMQGQGERVFELSAHLTIVRVPFTSAPSGLQVDQLIIAPRN